jgi:hypothetical protein
MLPGQRRRIPERVTCMNRNLDSTRPDWVHEHGGLVSGDYYVYLVPFFYTDDASAQVE